MNLSAIMPIVTKTTAKVGFQLSKHAPELLTYGGLATMIAGTGLTAKKSLRYLEIVSEPTLEDLVFIDQVKEDSDNGKTVDNYDDKMVRRDKFVVYSRLLVRTVKYYAVPIALTAVGTGMVISGHKMMVKRLAGALAAYGVLNEAYNNLKHKVMDSLDQETLDKVLESDIVLDEKTKLVDGERSKFVDPYVFIFDPSNVNFSTKSANEGFLRAQQRYFNDRLKARGFLFLNEVLESLGLPESRMGAIVGWMADDSVGDGYVSFGVSGAWNERIDSEGEYVSDYILDFNVDGPIIDRI